MIKFHIRKGKPFIHILSNFYEFLFTSTPSAAAIKWSVSEASFEETQEKLWLRHLEKNWCNFIFLCRVNIKSKHCRICWYKSFYSPNILALIRCQFLWVVFSEASPNGNFLPEHLQMPKMIKFTRIWMQFTPYYLLMSTNVCLKKFEIWWKTLCGDNWSAAIIGHFPVGSKHSGSISRNACVACET